MADTLSSSPDAKLENRRDTIHPPIEEPFKSPHSAAVSPPLTEGDAPIKADQESPQSVVKIPRNLQSLAGLPTESPIPSLLRDRYEQLPRAVGYLSNRRNASTCSASAPTSLQATNTATPST
jgi:hypothetical protein